MLKLNQSKSSNGLLNLGTSVFDYDYVFDYD